MSNQTAIANRNDVVEFNLIDVIRRVLRGKYVLLATTLLGFIIALIAAKVTKPWYYAQAVFLPPKYTDLTTNAPASSIFLGTGEASDAYLGLLASRTIQDDVVGQLNLRAVFHAPTQTAARSILSARSSFGVGRNSLIYVTIKSDDPQLAASIANAYLEALYRLNGQMVESSSARRRVFFQEQLEQQRDSLTKAEQDLKQTEERTGLVSTSGEVQADVNASAQLQTQIEASESRLAGLLVAETDQAPEVVQARAQLRQLRAELAEQLASGTTARRGVPSAGSLPGLSLDVQEKEREVRLNESAYESLLQQFGRARLASIDPGPQLEVVDRAVPPEYKAGPNRRSIVMYGVLIGFLAGLLYLIFFDPLRVILLRSTRAASEAR